MSNVGNKKISFNVENKIAKVGFGLQNKKSMTTLDQEALTELREIVLELKKLDEAKNIDAVIFHSLIPGCFIAGVDISLIASLKTESDGAHGAEQGQLIYNDIEDLKAQTIACVDGVCLGGGMELALSCKVILASDDRKTQMGLPEVKLGVLPGFGGTYRMPKKIGLPNALDLILTGKMVDGKKAKKMGLVEEVFAKEMLMDKALEFIKYRKRPRSFKENMQHMAVDNVVTRKIIFQKARESVLQKTKGFYQAPLKILDVMEGAFFKSRTSYLTSESQAFGELCTSEQSKNLQHIYFLTEKSKKYNGPKSSGKLTKISRGAALGAGTMGGGIAWLMAQNNMRPIMKDLATPALELGLKQASKNFMGQLKRKKISEDEFERKIRSITCQTDYQGFNSVDLVIEAVVENMDVKKKVFSELEKNVRPDCIITSNTSSLKVTEMTSALERPERFAGLHFFNPVHLMPLVEIVTHDKVSPETVEALYNWVLATKKTPVIVKDGPGFLVNRILMPYLNEAAFLLMEGVPMKDLDEACLNFGMPMGPCRLMDEIGIDVGAKVAHILEASLGKRAKACPSSEAVAKAGFLGKKNSKGFYLYDPSGKPTIENTEATKLFSTTVKSMDEVEIQKRVILPMINEASIILEEGLVASAAEVDLALIYGIGFPPFRGGLLKYADFEGLDKICKDIERFGESVDADRYNLSPYLKKLAQGHTKFYEIN